MPLFASPFTPTALTLTSTRVLERGTVVLTYDLRAATNGTVVG